MRKQNSKGDFSVSHKFYRNGGQIDVPSHMDIRYFTDEMCGVFVVERNGTKQKNCSISEDNKILISHLSLSDKYIGNGQLRYILTEYIKDDDFPDGERSSPVPGVLNVLLWTGPSDYDTLVMETTSLQGEILAQIRLLTPQRVESEEVMEQMIANGTYIEGQIYYTEEK